MLHLRRQRANLSSNGCPAAGLLRHCDGYSTWWTLFGADYLSSLRRRLSRRSWFIALRGRNYFSWRMFMDQPKLCGMKPMRFPWLGIYINIRRIRSIIQTNGVGSTVATIALVSASGVALLSNNEAGAMGGGNPAAAMQVANTQSFDMPSTAQISRRLSAVNGWRPVHLADYPRRSARREPQPAGVPVCVRLCDGSFFPSNTFRAGMQRATHNVPTRQPRYIWSLLLAE